MKKPTTPAPKPPGPLTACAVKLGKKGGLASARKRQTAPRAPRKTAPRATVPPRPLTPIESAVAEVHAHCAAEQTRLAARDAARQKRLAG